MWKIAEADRDGILTFDHAKTLMSLDHRTVPAKWTAATGDVRAFFNIPIPVQVRISVDDVSHQMGEVSFCTFCGASVAQGAGNFCAKCGKKLT